ncbi:MAG TPA: flagellar hook-associated protein FlgK [Firmicutes bacterium]|nr:flagellar hook-associated protein FlgK [Bacillota bacterium]
MRATFSGIEIARRALQAQQLSLDTVGQNIANANTPGYSRQVAVHTASRPYPVPQFTHNPINGMLGTGVEIARLSRMRDEFIEMRLRQEQHNLNYWEMISDGLEQVELIYNEPSENGIHHALELFWDAWQELSINPHSEAVRSVVLQRGEVVASAINHVRYQLGKLRDNYNDLVAVKVDEINSYAERIAELNRDIVKVIASGYQPNDLMDQRDQLLQELSEIANIEVVVDKFGAVSVSISGATLVQRTEVFKLDVRPAATASVPPYDRVEVIWEGSNVLAEIRGGELAGILDFRDRFVQDYIHDLNQWTADLMNTVNDIHRQGVDLNGSPGQAFFIPAHAVDPVTADQDPSLHIKVGLQHPAQIAASALVDDNGDVVVGNGEIALELAQLRHTPIDHAGNTIGSYFNAIVSKIGVDALEGNSMVNNGDALINHLENMREAVSGVNLDEEMADMIRFQHAYAAAARMMTTMDQVLEIIVNRLGLFGR